MILFLLTAAPLLTYGTALIEAGANERGESFLTSLLSTDISLETRNRALYNLGVSALRRGAIDEALENFQAITHADEPLDPFVKKGIREALTKKEIPPFLPLPPLPSPLTLKTTVSELEFLSKDLTSLPFENGEETPGYHQLQERLDLILQKKGEWWGSIIAKQQELLPQGCLLKHWEDVVEKIGEGTDYLQRADLAFKRRGKPYADIYPPLQEGIKLLTAALKEVEEEMPSGGPLPETERFDLLTEMFRKDRKPAPPLPKDALW